MAGTPRQLAGPVALANGTYVTNIYNPASALIYGVITHIHVNNNTASPITFRLYRGATGANAAGTDLAYNKVVPANDFLDLYWQTRFDSTDFLVGGAASAGLTISVEGFEAVK
jgi:hypothetical protein